MRTFLSLSVFLVFLTACNSTSSSLDYGTSDFTPPSEIELGMGNDGPFEQRLLSAHSDDGIHWTRDNRIITEQGNTCDMVRLEDGTLILYYVGGNILDQRETIAAAISQDEGNTWAFKSVNITGVTEKHPPFGDPDIALLEDGTFRLYFTTQLPGEDGPGIHYADGTDGLNFEYQGLAFAYNEGDHKSWDSSAFYIDGHWAMLTFDNFGSATIHAVSEDGGKSYSFVKLETLHSSEGKPYFLSNPFTLPDGSVRFWAFQLGDTNGFRSFITKDGLTWEDEGYQYLTYTEGTNELEGYYIKDPVVVQLSDGTYFMVYVSRAPDTSVSR